MIIKVKYLKHALDEGRPIFINTDQITSFEPRGNKLYDITMSSGFSYVIEEADFKKIKKLIDKGAKNEINND